jgi:hypothetical protein
MVKIKLLVFVEMNLNNYVLFLLIFILTLCGRATTKVAVSVTHVSARSRL